MQYPISNIQYRQAFVIGLLSLFSCLFLFRSAQASTLYIQSASQNVNKDQTFVVDWFLDSEGESINTVDLKVSYNNKVLSVEEASPGNSIISLWVQQPVFDNNIGQIQLVGGVPNGFRGKNIPLFRSTFKAIANGNAEITMATDSVILKNDGQGTSAVLKFKPVEFTIGEPVLVTEQINSPTHPDQNVWYADNSVAIDYKPQPGVEYSYSFSSNIEVIPDQIADLKPEQLSFNDLPDGIYYFKLLSYATGTAWNEVGVFRVKIDKTPPEEFTPEIGQDPASLKDKFLSFSAVDKMSGISHYKVKVWPLHRDKNSESPYKISKPLVDSTIAVTAFDYAGNTRQAVVGYKGYLPRKVFVALCVLIALVLLVLIARKKFKKIKIK